MSKFAIKRIESVKGKQIFYQLLVAGPNTSEDGAAKELKKVEIGVLDVYEAELENKYKKDLKGIYAYMNLVANNQPVSNTKYHELNRPKNDIYADFEFKHGDLRVYGFKTQAGKVIVVAGYKNEQKQYINQLRSLKQQYFNNLKK